MDQQAATLIGMTSIVLWASMVGLIKQVSSLLGASLGVALVYTVSALLLLLIFKIPKVHQVPKTFLWVSAALFVSYELCFSFAVAYARTETQAIEVSILNYLWPCLTIVALVLAKELKFNAVVLMGLIVCLYGVAVIQMGLSLDIAMLLRNAASNPVSYVLATVGAVIWAVYCVIIKKMSGRHNLIALYFVLTALMMWLKYMLFDRSVPDEISPMSILYVLAAGAAIGLGYGAWNFGILKGNTKAMVVASYFTPVLSSVIAAILLGVSLSSSFWLGVALVSGGSLVCYLATSNLIRLKR